ncbi:MAG: hypothetical protein H0U81_00060 [Pyrinomonadaceae bacterium]|nr:hypothetical protein [Pyrinomonadaceae bacterium]
MFAKQGEMFLHSPFGFVQTIFEGMSNAGKAFQFGRVEAEKIGVSGRLNDERIFQVKHRASTPFLNAGGFQDGMASAGWNFLRAMIVNSYQICRDRVCCNNESSPSLATI